MYLLWREEREKVRKSKTSFSLQSSWLFPRSFTLLRNFMEYESQLGNFKENKKWEESVF